jgi:hypothetical protein
MRKFAVATSILVIFAVLAAPASAVKPGPVQASISPEATLVEGGAAALVTVTVRCAGGSNVLEAFIYVTQEGQQSRFTPIQVRCGGKARTYVVRVPAPEGTTFKAGTAQASGFILVEKKDVVTSTSPSQTLTLS